MTDNKNLNEEEVFEQEVNDEELTAVSGGRKPAPFSLGCENSSQRYIYDWEFPNCASSVEEGSWCGSADACVKAAIEYLGMRSCTKSWK